MYDSHLRIKRTGNGYAISMRDPDIVKKNREDKGPYRDPEVEFVFADKDKSKMMTFVTGALDKLKPGDEYDTAFSAALLEDDDEQGTNQGPDR